MTNKITQVIKNNRKYSVTELPNTNIFKFEITNWKGAHLERVYQIITGSNVFGASHLVEHLSFKSTRDYSTDELTVLLKQNGECNASTTFETIDYYYLTIMQNMHLAIKMVCNIAFNDLVKISDGEFSLEKDVVCNEVKRYLDDGQTEFFFDLVPALYGYCEDDCLVGSVDTVEQLKLADCAALKKMFLNEADHTYSIVYDPTVSDIDTIISVIESNIDTFNLDSEMNNEISSMYFDKIGLHKNGSILIPADTDQVLTAILFNNVKNYYVAKVANEYIAELAEGTSLNDYIREKHGLTYSIMLSLEYNNYEHYTVFECDVSPGTENKMLELFQESVNDTAANFSEEKHKVFIDYLKLKTSLRLLNQKAYLEYENDMFQIENWNDYSEIFSKDMKAGIYAIIDSISFDIMAEYLNDFKNRVNDKKYAMVVGQPISGE